MGEQITTGSIEGLGKEETEDVEDVEIGRMDSSGGMQGKLRIGVAS